MEKNSGNRCKKPVATKLIQFSAVALLLFSASAPNAYSDDAPMLPLTGEALGTLTSGRLSEPKAVKPDYNPGNLKGWDHLYSLLHKGGISKPRAAALLKDARMPAREALYFSLDPKESKHLYRKHNTPRARQNALAFYLKHKGEFERAEKLYEVPKSVILSILQVETQCGRYTGRSSVFYRLARLAAAGTPSNVRANYDQKRKNNKSLQLSKVQNRAAWLEQEFLPHVIATVHLADQLGIHPHQMEGSSAGAIGMPQFLPGNVERFGRDGNNDGRVDLFEPADAIHSVANYLKAHGWKKTSTRKEQRQAIWYYNRSTAYIDTVLAMSDALNPSLKKKS